MHTTLVLLALLQLGTKPAGDEIRYKWKVHSYNVLVSEERQLQVDLLDVAKLRIGSYTIDQRAAPAVRAETIVYRTASLVIIKQATPSSLAESWLDEAGRSVTLTGVYNEAAGTFELQANDPATAEAILAEHKREFELIEALVLDLDIRLVALASDPEEPDTAPDRPPRPCRDPYPLPWPYPRPQTPILMPTAEATTTAEAVEPPLCEREYSVKGWGLGKGSRACRAAVRRAHEKCANELCDGCCELSEAGNAGADQCDCFCAPVGDFMCGCTIEGKKCTDAMHCQSGVGGELFSDGLSVYKVTIMPGSPDCPPSPPYPYPCAPQDIDGTIHAYVWSGGVGRFQQIGRQQSGVGKTTILGTPPAGVPIGFYMQATCASVNPNNGLLCTAGALVGSKTNSVKLACSRGVGTFSIEQTYGSNCLGQGESADCDDAVLLIEKQ